MGYYPRKLTPGTLQGDAGGSVDRAFVVDAISTPVVLDVDRVLSDQATSASVITTVTAFLAQPDVPRTIEIINTGTAADVPAGDITIVGTDSNNQVITEALTFTANLATKVVSTKAFKTITSIAFPIQDGAAATYDVGIGAGLGLMHVLTDEQAALVKLFDSAADAGTFTLNADVAKMLYTPAGTPDGAKILRLIYVA